MGDSWGNEPVEIIPGTPEDVAGVRSSLINMIMNGQNLGATRYGHNTPHTDAAGRTTYSFTPYQINAGTNPQQLSATNMMSRLAGTPQYIPATNNLFPHPDLGVFTPALPGEEDGSRSDPGPRRNPRPPNPDPGSGSNPGRRSGPGPSPMGGDVDEEALRRRLMALNIARRQRQLGV
jgi:hypothetical protein